jgi:hypothetical protein
MPDELFTGNYIDVYQRLARREVERHQKRLVGLTASAPKLITTTDGRNEFTCSVRIGVKEEQGLVKDVLIAQWAIGIISDINVPVLMERSEAGRLTIISRAQVRLPNVRLTQYSWGSLDLVFASNFDYDAIDQVWKDGYDYPTLANPEGDVSLRRNWVWQQHLVSLDDFDDETELDEVDSSWILA